MSEQRLFFALWPDDRQRERLRDTMSPLARQVEGRAVPRTNWHVTLKFVGNVPSDRTAALQAAIAGIQVDEFRLRFDRLAFWQRPRIACLQSVTVPSELESLVTRLNAACEPFGIEPEAGHYRPHITAVRAARAFEPIMLARPLELSFSGFELVESVSTTEGVKYRPLKQ